MSDAQLTNWSDRKLKPLIKEKEKAITLENLAISSCDHPNYLLIKMISEGGSRKEGCEKLRSMWSVGMCQIF